MLMPLFRYAAAEMLTFRLLRCHLAATRRLRLPLFLPLHTLFLMLMLFFSPPLAYHAAF